MSTPQEIQRRFRGLPADLQEAIFSVDTSEIIREIAKKYKLPVDVMGGLADAVEDFLLGFTKPENFLGGLQKNLELDSETARHITEDLNLQLFARVRNSLRHLHTSNDDGVVPVPSSMPTPVMPAAPPVPQTPAPSPAAPGPFESKLQEKIFSAEKELSEARTQKIYPGNKDPYREPTN